MTASEISEIGDSPALRAYLKAEAAFVKAVEDARADNLSYRDMGRVARWVERADDALVYSLVTREDGTFSASALKEYCPLEFVLTVSRFSYSEYERRTLEYRFRVAVRGWFAPQRLGLLIPDAKEVPSPTRFSRYFYV